ncbi:MAG: hypothetical protein HOC33_06755 [Alphaproteobacteria bacterium]|jgi:hypothetical protein|nr:hypothetical protein [Alphaproteobacteria bacterium]MBT4086755.1 hypothetical protein [Alphaproteobacteria bacterium]MBT4543529.1 hypothetical protein [Alphaproteobacteria bacterium]
MNSSNKIELTPSVLNHFQAEVKATWDRSIDVRNEFGGNFDRYFAFVKADAYGKVKILNGAAKIEH